MLRLYLLISLLVLLILLAQYLLFIIQQSPLYQLKLAEHHPQIYHSNPLMLTEIFTYKYRL